MNMVPSLYFVDFYDVAVAACVWELRQWNRPYFREWSRINPGGVAVVEVCSGTSDAETFLETFEYDQSLATFLSEQPALAWINGDFWQFLIGQRFRGRFRALEEGVRLPNGVTYARMMGGMGEVLLFQGGVRTIFDFQIGLAAEAYAMISAVGGSVTWLDESSVRTFGYGWSLWHAHAGLAAGMSPAI